MTRPNPFTAARQSFAEALREWPATAKYFRTWYLWEERSEEPGEELEDDAPEPSQLSIVDCPAIEIRPSGSAPAAWFTDSEQLFPYPILIRAWIPGWRYQDGERWALEIMRAVMESAPAGSTVPYTQSGCLGLPRPPVFTVERGRLNEGTEDPGSKVTLVQLTYVARVKLLFR